MIGNVQSSRRTGRSPSSSTDQGGLGPDDVDHRQRLLSSRPSRRTAATGGTLYGTGATARLFRRRRRDRQHQWADRPARLQLQFATSNADDRRRRGRQRPRQRQSGHRRLDRGGTRANAASTPSPSPRTRYSMMRRAIPSSSKGPISGICWWPIHPANNASLRYGEHRQRSNIFGRARSAITTARRSGAPSPTTTSNTSSSASATAGNGARLPPPAARISSSASSLARPSIARAGYVSVVDVDNNHVYDQISGRVRLADNTVVGGADQQPRPVRPPRLYCPSPASRRSSRRRTR